MYRMSYAATAALTLVMSLAFGCAPDASGPGDPGGAGGAGGADDFRGGDDRSPDRLSEESACERLHSRIEECTGEEGDAERCQEDMDQIDDDGAVEAVSCVFDCWSDAPTCDEFGRLVTESCECERSCGVTSDACPAPGSPPPPPPPASCDASEYTCGSGGCIPDGWVCDGEADCGDGSDEQGCPPVNACQACVEGSCGGPLATCNGNVICVRLFNCLGECDGTDACTQYCVDMYPAGVEDLVDFLECMSSRCSGACG